MTGDDAETAREELRHLDQLLARTRSRVDPHAFHYVHWGIIVLIWYPLANALSLLGHPWWQIPVSVVALAIGISLSVLREKRLERNPRLPGEDTTLARQVAWISWAGVSLGFVLSGLAPATGFIDGANVPILWGLIYANIAFHTGVVYRREFFWAAAFILAGVLLAMFFQAYSGIILGPFMGLGLILPGLRAEKSVRALQAEAAAA